MRRLWSLIEVVQDAILDSFIESLYILNIKDLYITEGKVIRKDEEGYEIFDGALDIFNVLQYMYEVFPDLCLKNT